MPCKLENLQRKVPKRETTELSVPIYQELLKQGLPKQKQLVCFFFLTSRFVVKNVIIPCLRQFVAKVFLVFGTFEFPAEFSGIPSALVQVGVD